MSLIFDGARCREFLELMVAWGARNGGFLLLPTPCRACCSARRGASSSRVVQLSVLSEALVCTVLGTVYNGCR